MEFEKGRDIEPVQEKLDVEYRQILRIIKPYIQTINNNNYLAQYRIWLEKLSETKDNEKFIRNQYLMELARQIQCKNLASPFTQTPPKGALPPLRGHHRNFEEPVHTSYEQPMDTSDPYLTKQRMCQQWTEENECNLALNRGQWPYHSASPRPRRQSSNQQLFTPDQMSEAQRCVKRSATSVKKISLLKEIDEQTSKKFMEVGDTGSSPSRSPSRPHRNPPNPTPPPPPTAPKDIRLDLDPKKRHQTFTPQNPSLGVIHEDHADLNEEESWCDLSDASNVSLAVLGSGDTESKEHKKVNQQGEHFEKKINTLMIEINGLKKKSEKMNERCEHTLSEYVRCKKDAVEQTHSTEKDGSFMKTDWIKTVESLQVRLSETQHQNKELNGLISTLHKKIKEMDASKEKVKYEIKKQILDEHKKEIESINMNHANDINEMQMSHEKKIKEIEEGYEKQKIELEMKYEREIKDIEDRCAKQINEKEVEINRLEDIVQKECMRLINEITVLRSQIEEAAHTNTSNDERILFLQKCITKMDRLFQKSEREYCKQIEKLRQELDNRDKAIQIQLQTQKAEVITRCSAEKQSELDNIVENLESKYTNLLEMQQAQIAVMKNEDEKIINDLRLILDQHNIPY